MTSQHPEEIWNIHFMQFLGDTGLSSISQNEMLDHMAGVCVRKRKVCWTCSRENGSKIVKSSERPHEAKRGKMGTGGVNIFGY